MNERNYIFVERETPNPSNMMKSFQLHTHVHYEIFCFLNGDAKYLVESKTYSLEPYDIIVVRKDELHRIYHNSPSPYHRIVLEISPTFFVENNCREYESYFLNTEYESNKIPAKVVLTSGLYDAIMRYKKYSQDFTLKDNVPILRSVIIEILYLISETTAFQAPLASTGPINSIISYLNTSYTGDISLDMLEKKFSFSKCYLCRAFRKATGLTIQRYVRIKRLAHVRDLRSRGMRMGDAAMASGFRDYSSFYRAYQKEYGHAPSMDLSQ